MKGRQGRFSVVALAILAVLVLKSDRGQSETSARSPVIVNQLSLLNQTRVPSSITLFTPTAEGLYRITAYGNVTPRSNPADICPTVSWTDEIGSQTGYVFWGSNNNDGNCTNSSYAGDGVHSVPDSPVVLNLQLIGSLDGQYNLLVTVEKL